MSTSPDVEIDLDFRPSSYFWPLGLGKHLLARVKGAKRKAALKALIDAGRLDEIPDFLAQSSLSEVDRQAIGRIHPMFMGGEYLRDLDETEIEIARISIRSTTSDVTSMYARRGEGWIHYRVVDEYGGDTLTGIAERTSETALTLGELYQFFAGAWPLMGVLKMNYGDDLSGMLAFFRGDSAFYPKFDALLRREVESRYAAPAER
jgi:hypothetical protein